MTYEVNTPGYRTIFEERDVGNPHTYSVTRHSDIGYRITRYNTIDECAVQVAGLACLLAGSRHEEMSSDHHYFRFDRVNDDEVHVKCDDDVCTLWWTEVEAQLVGYSKCIWNEKVEYSQGASALRESKDQIISVLGEKPPFVANVEGVVATARYNDSFMYEILPTLACALGVCIGVAIIGFAGSLVYTGITNVMGTSPAPKLWVNALAPTRTTPAAKEVWSRKVSNQVDKQKWTHEEALKLLGYNTKGH